MNVINLFLNKLDHLKFKLVAMAYIDPVNRTIDIGCGNHPQQFIKARWAVGVDPVRPRDLLSGGLTGYIQGDWQYAIDFMREPRLKYDTAVLMGIVEHLPKEESVRLLRETEKVVAHQIVVFTPLGFMEQDAGEHDYNTHRSGWYPQDFGNGWRVFVFHHFHWCDFNGVVYDEPKGAILAIYTKE